jgi:hypothetical protein
MIDNLPDLSVILIQDDEGKHLLARLFMTGVRHKIGNPDLTIEKDVAEYLSRRSEFLKVTE